MNDNGGGDESRKRVRDKKNSAREGKNTSPLAKEGCNACVEWTVRNTSPATARRKDKRAKKGIPHSSPASTHSHAPLLGLSHLRPPASTAASAVVRFSLGPARSCRTTPTKKKPSFPLPKREIKRPLTVRSSGGEKAKGSGASGRVGGGSGIQFATSSAGRETSGGLESKSESTTSRQVQSPRPESKGDKMCSGRRTSPAPPRTLLPHRPPILPNPGRVPDARMGEAPPQSQSTAEAQAKSWESTRSTRREAPRRTPDSRSHDIESAMKGGPPVPNAPRVWRSGDAAMSQSQSQWIGREREPEAAAGRAAWIAGDRDGSAQSEWDITSDVARTSSREVEARFGAASEEGEQKGDVRANEESKNTSVRHGSEERLKRNEERVAGMKGEEGKPDLWIRVSRSQRAKQKAMEGEGQRPGKYWANATYWDSIQAVVNLALPSSGNDLVSKGRSGEFEETTRSSRKEAPRKAAKKSIENRQRWPSPNRRHEGIPKKRKDEGAEKRVDQPDQAQLADAVAKEGVIKGSSGS
ncbi:hypothetical protein C8R45DRAFT_927653 [Mycena sanguinolenta]|nr:hypothetical protein C8R45DRAFT_927653 [Mycena sanguinolenta]